MGLVVILSPSAKFRDPLTRPVMDLSEFCFHRLMVGTPAGAFFAGALFLGGGKVSSTGLLPPPPRPKREIVALDTALEMASNAAFCRAVLSLAAWRAAAFSASSSTDFFATGLTGGFSIGIVGEDLEGTALLAGAGLFLATGLEGEDNLTMGMVGKGMVGEDLAGGAFLVAGNDFWPEGVEEKYGREMLGDCLTGFSFWAAAAATFALRSSSAFFAKISRSFFFWRASFFFCSANSWRLAAACSLAAACAWRFSSAAFNLSAAACLCASIFSRRAALAACAFLALSAARFSASSAFFCSASSFCDCNACRRDSRSLAAAALSSALSFEAAATGGGLGAPCKEDSFSDTDGGTTLFGMGRVGGITGSGVLGFFVFLVLGGT
mmetsp:Transcript_14957/g.30499  ORF Transcript_14957/g.30499 Transcript_14957/m.30499 type:complete len:380 (-) Transcript_14957:622-1761(-)